MFQLHQRRTIRRQIHHQVENSKVLFWLLFAIGMNRACSIVPDMFFDPFPFYDITISVSFYIYVISNHCFILILFYLLTQTAMGEMFRIMVVFFWLQFLSLLDFILIYEHPIFYVGRYGVEYTDFKVLMYTYLIIRWNRTQS